MLRNMKIGVRLGIGFGLMIILIAVLAFFGIARINQLNDGINNVVNDRMVKTRISNEIIDQTNISARAVRDMFLLSDPKSIKQEEQAVKDAGAIITTKLDTLDQTVISESGKKILATLKQARGPFVDTRKEMLDLFYAGKKEESIRVLQGDYRDKQDTYLNAVKALIDFQISKANVAGKAASDLASQTADILIGLAVLSLLFGLFVAWAITRSITKPISQCIEATEAIARGEIPQQNEQESWGEFDLLRKSLNNSIHGLQGLVEAEHVLQRMAVNDYTVKMTGSYNGIYSKVCEAVNNVQARIINAIHVMQKMAVGDFDAELESLKKTGKRSEQDEFMPAYIGAMESIKALVLDANILARAAIDGRLATRADASKHQGDFRKVVQGVNDTLDSVINPLNVTAKYVDDISKGIIPALITDNYNGDFNVIKTNLNSVVKMMGNLLTETDILVNAALSGSLSTRAKADLFLGGWNQLVTGINKTLDSVLEPINEAAGILDKVAARDMSARVMGNYSGDHAKIKNSLNLAVENLDKALAQVSDATSQVSSASQQISAGSQSLAQGANEQASSLEEVSSSLEEMASMTKQNADNAVQAKNLAGESNDSAKVGSEAMGRMSSAILRIKESSDQTAKIVKTIDEIAMQTNLLALNAAVEAARAGEAGRGFAVVAEEVRNLAQRSAQAAKNTADMIGESVKNAEDGVKIAQEVTKSFTEIATGAKKVNDLIAEIAAASKEQSQGIEQVNTAVSQMDKVTQQNAANSEESASAAEELSSQSEELQAMVGQFKLSQGSATPHRAALAHQNTHHALPPPTKIAHKAPMHKAANKTVSAEEIIPFDDDSLKEF